MLSSRPDDAGEVREAERCERMLWDEMVAAGFVPYRVSIDQMERLTALEPELFELVAQLKNVLDPHGIVAPGRYALLPNAR
jgi:4-cresol dehydrogenase (hydroxylating) flavoprotein subunit